MMASKSTFVLKHCPLFLIDRFPYPSRNLIRTCPHGLQLGGDPYPPVAPMAISHPHATGFKKTMGRCATKYSRSSLVIHGTLYIAYSLTKLGVQRGPP